MKRSSSWRNRVLSLESVRAEAEPFIGAGDLHPALELMRASFLERYDRVERVLFACGFDFNRFPSEYWRTQP